MMDMEERVARAICEADDFSWESLLGGDATAIRQKKYRVLARAAIAAMREPTQAQYEALCATSKMWANLDSKTVWQIYIDAALSTDTHPQGRRE